MSSDDKFMDKAGFLYFWQQLKIKLDEIKNSVSNGKALVANAITAKGVTTATDASFETMANNIASIVTGSTGSRTAYGTGTAKGSSSEVHYIQVTGLSFRPSKALIWFEGMTGRMNIKFITTEYVIEQKQNTAGTWDSFTRGAAGSGGTSFTSSGFKTNFAGRSGKTFYYFAIE